MYCTKCGHQLRESLRFCPQCGAEVKGVPPRPVVEVPPKKSRKPTLVAVGFVIVIVLFGLVMLITELTRAEHPVISKQPVVSEPIDYANEKIGMVDVPFRVEGGKILFSLEDVKRHRLVRIQYKGQLTDIPVLAYISGEGRLVTAISRSEPDNATTFSIEGDAIKCGNCPANWNLNNMKANACCPRYFPDPIPSTVEGDEVQIQEELIANWTTRL